MADRELAIVAQNLELPSPPYVYRNVTALLFESDGSENSLLIGRFQGTPVGDFDEIWFLRKRKPMDYDLRDIYVNNAQRCEAGRRIWRMPKHMASIDLEGDVSKGLRSQFISNAATGELAIQLMREPSYRTEPLSAISLRSDDRNWTRLSFPTNSRWRHAIAGGVDGISGDIIEGRALIICGKCTLQQPEVDTL